jgi:hypothetical protein
MFRPLRIPHGGTRVADTTSLSRLASSRRHLTSAGYDLGLIFSDHGTDDRTGFKTTSRAA